MTSPGKLDEPITIESFVESGRGSVGQTLGSWQQFAKVWASVYFLTADESHALSAQTIETIARFRIRYLAGVTHVMRIRWGADEYLIETIDQTRRRSGETRITARLARPAPK